MKTGTPLPWMSLVLLAVLVAVSPYAMGFPLAEMGRAAKEDPLNGPRGALILLGLIAFLLSAVEVAVTGRRHGWKAETILPVIALAIACFVIGWRLMPYWALGTYQQSIGGQPFRDMDPKNHMPMIWIGELWRLPILLFQFLAFALLPGGAFAAIILLGRRHYLPAAITFGGIAIAAYYFFRFRADYIVWLMD